MGARETPCCLLPTKCANICFSANTSTFMTKAGWRWRESNTRPRTKAKYIRIVVGKTTLSLVMGTKTEDQRYPE